jgi:hypothetical protein
MVAREGWLIEREEHRTSLETTDNPSMVAREGWLIEREEHRTSLETTDNPSNSNNPFDGSSTVRVNAMFVCSKFSTGSLGGVACPAPGEFGNTILLPCASCVCVSFLAPSTSGGGLLRPTNRGRRLGEPLGELPPPAAFFSVARFGDAFSGVTVG